MLQDEYFKKDEGDNWFKRNKDALTREEKIFSDIPFNMINEYGIKPDKILELGCSNGYRLHALETLNPSKVIGIDVSSVAVEDGKKRYPGLDLRVGEMASLPLADERFDLVIVNFVLHWVSRNNFFKAISEIDRVIEEGGILVLGDFLPDIPTKVKYHHRDEEIFTYKMDYTKVFTGSNLYSTIAVKTFDHDLNNRFNPGVQSSSRGLCSLLRKNSQLFVY